MIKPPQRQWMEGLRKTLTTSVTHTVSEEAAVPRVRGGENRSEHRSDQTSPGQKPRKYSTHTLTPMSQLLILCRAATVTTTLPTWCVWGHWFSRNWFQKPFSRFNVVLYYIILKNKIFDILRFIKYCIKCIK